MKDKNAYSVELINRVAGEGAIGSAEVESSPAAPRVMRVEITSHAPGGWSAPLVLVHLDPRDLVGVPTGPSFRFEVLVTAEGQPLIVSDFGTYDTRAQIGEVFDIRGEGSSNSWADVTRVAVRVYLELAEG